MGTDDLRHPLEVPARRHDVAAHPLDRLGDEGCRAAVGSGLDDFDQVARVDLDQFLVAGVPERGAVRVGGERVRDPRHGAGEHPPRRVPGERGSHAGAAVIRLAKRDDLGAPGVQARSCECRFDRFRAAVEKEGAAQVARRDLRQAPRGFDLAIVDIERRQVAHTGRLFLHGGDHGGVTVAQRGGEDAGEGIEVFAPVEVPHPATRPFGDGQRLVVQRLHAVEEVTLLLGEDVGASQGGGPGRGSRGLLASADGSGRSALGGGGHGVAIRCMMKWLRSVKGRVIFAPPSGLVQSRWRRNQPGRDGGKLVCGHNGVGLGAI